MRRSPSALNDFLACRYLTWLEAEREAGRIDYHEIPRPDAELVRERGLRHEDAFRRSLIHVRHAGERWQRHVGELVQRSGERGERCS
ncbi:MAG TPA: hypothetical protein VGP30_01905, partial [Candidatus Limnocylindrales bacterium]|nr:hypothetical protein [Candidatus Limnocylindrales bacterium]